MLQIGHPHPVQSPTPPVFTFAAPLPMPSHAAAAAAIATRPPPSSPASPASATSSTSRPAPASPAPPSSSPRPTLLPLLLLLPLRTLSALRSPPADCDEVFNYWEPLHFLHFTTGLQTWEYSPAFALRSYAFLLPYLPAVHLAAPLSHLLPSPSPKLLAFYLVRLSHALLLAVCEALLHRAASRRFGPHLALPFAVFLLSSPGLFRAAAELLPSTFALCLLTAAAAHWLALRFTPAVILVAIAALLGWVFAAALALPLALHLLLSKRGPALFFRTSIPAGVAILAFMAVPDSFYYGKPVLAPLNHLLYNVFPSSPDAGSHIFGVEPPSFYLLNLVLNSTLPALLFAAFPLIALCCALSGVYAPDVPTHLWNRLVFLSPAYIYLAILVPQPHKEERFLAPSYTFIALVAAVAFVDAVALLRRLVHRLSGPTIARFAANLVSLALLVLCIVIGASRIVMQVKSFQAPLQVYTHLSDVELRRGKGPRDAPSEYMSPTREVNVCVGKEWYRFPSSFFLPDRRFRIRFVRAGFTGLMPKPFQEDANGTRVIPAGMNEFNREDPEQFYDWAAGEGCHYFVDLDLSYRSSGNGDDSASKYGSPIPEEARHVVCSKPFLDSEMSSQGYRAFFLPGFEHKLVHGQYQLIRNLNLLPIVR